MRPLLRRPRIPPLLRFPLQFGAAWAARRRAVAAAAAPGGGCPGPTAAAEGARAAVLLDTPPDGPAGCKTLHLIRHAQGYHNEAEEAWARDGHPRPADVLLRENSGMRYWDARLTPLGVEQSRALRARIGGAAAAGAAGLWALDPCPLPLDVVVTSTLTRAVQTAHVALGAPGHPRREGPRWVATERCRERVADYTCDGRRPVAELVEEFPWLTLADDVESGERDAMWWDAKETADGEAACRQRAVEFAGWLLALPAAESRIAVVSHSHFLYHFVGTLAGRGEPPRLGNAEMRTMYLCPA